MRITLACFAFLMSAFGFLACGAIALDGLDFMGATLPVLHANGGITPIGGLLLLLSGATGLVFLGAGLSVVNRETDPV